MAKLLQGYTHLINPINLIPNSDFSQNGGGGLLSEPVHYDLMDSSVMNISTSPYCCYRFKIIAFQTMLSNVNIVRSRNSLRVSGYFSRKTASATVRYGLRIFPDGYIAQKDKTYTFIIKSVKNNNISKRIHIRPVLVAQADVYYENESEGTVVFRQAYTQDYMIAANVIMDDLQEGDFFDFTITGMYLYEGAYLNPPLVNSLDTKPDEGDIFLHKDGINYPIYQLSRNVSQDNKYRKIMEFGYINNLMYYFEFLINKHWNASSCQMFRVQLCVSGSGLGGFQYNCSMNVKTFSLQSPIPTYYVSKFYVSYLKTGFPFLSLKLTSNGGKNDWSISPLILSVRSPGGGLRFSPQNFNMGMTPIDNIGTVIKEVAPTEGF